MKPALLLTTIFLASSGLSLAQAETRLVPIAKGWARSSINTVVFRRNSVVTHDEHQYVAFYDPDAFVVLAKRRLGSDDWEIRKTEHKGNARDAHNSISIMVDGDGYLMMNHYDVKTKKWTRRQDAFIHGEDQRNAYWRPKGTDVPQYHLVYHDGTRWQTLQIGKRTTPFKLSGGGTKRFPISRCQIVDQGDADKDQGFPPQEVSVLEWKPK